MNSTTLTPPLQNFSLFNFPLQRKTARFLRNSSFSFNSFSPLHPLRLPPPSAALRLVRCSASDNKRRPITQKSSLKHYDGGLDVAKPIAYALFYVFIGLFCPFLGFRKPALAAVAAAPSATIAKEDDNEKGHKYSQYTRRLLASVSKLLKVIEEARNEDFAAAVEDGLKEVKKTKSALQEEILDGLYSELSVLNAEKEALMDRTEEIMGKSLKLKKEEQCLTRKAKGGGDKLQRLREEKMGWDLGERI